MSEYATKTKTSSWQPTTQGKTETILPARPFPVPNEQVTTTEPPQDLTGYEKPQAGDVMDNIRRSLLNNPSEPPTEPTQSQENKIIAPAPQILGFSLQAKLSIGQPGDRYEQEADQVASQVVKQINAPTEPTVQRQQIQAPPIPTYNLYPQEKELKLMPLVQAKESMGGTTATSDLETSIQGMRGGGYPLEANLVNKMGDAFGADFTGVRVHTDAQSDQLNRSIQAKAFTTGQDIFFRQGAYDPASHGGQELIAHELTHVVQQNGSTIKPKSISNSNQKHNREKITPTTIQAQKTLLKAPNLNIQRKGQTPEQILEQLKNTPPTKAVATYNQAQTNSAQALENQKKEVQKTIPEIPPTTGLPPQTSAQGTPRQITDKTVVAGVGTVEKAGQIKDKTAIAGVGSAIVNQIKSISNKVSSEVNIEAGERPKVDLTGEANPSQMDESKTQSNQQVQVAKNQAAEGIKQNFGENNIFPKVSKQILKANKELAPVSSPQGKLGVNPAISPEIVGGLNQGLTPFYREKIGPEQDKYQIGKEKFNFDANNARTESNQKIQNLKQETTQKQLEEQKKAKQEVTKARQDWKKEIDNTDKTYQEKAGKASQEQRQKIEQEKVKGEQEADKKITEAEKKAAEEKKKADEKAAKEKEKGERKSVGDKILGAIGDVWEGIKSAVNAIYDTLRQVVKGIFDAIKQVVNGIIDLARQAIVGLIKAFGEILKGLVQVVFAAFPEISKKFTDIIDKAVNKATELVNAAADFLQKGISGVLDFLSSTLDKLLGLIQDLYNGIFTVIGMIIKGDFAELIKRFGNLIEGAKAMPPQFETAGLEELMGGDVDLDKPLAPEELAQAQQAGISIPGKAGEGTPQTGEGEELLSEENIGVDAVENNMELSPEIADELIQQTNGEGEVMLAQSDEESRSMESVMAEATKQLQGEGEKQQEQIPDDGLSPKERAGIKWELMKQGIKQWFSKNWPILLAGLIGATAVIIAAIVASGGAILAALPVIMEILTVVFVAETIAKIGGNVRDYLSKGWNGDIQSSGKSLAKALAAGAIEAIMWLTFEAGKVAAKGAKALAKVAKAAAKGAVKLTKAAFKGVIKGVKFVIEKGKVLFKGIAGSGLGKQFKRLKDLGKGLLDRMRFKAFRVRVANGWFRLEGLINPWVLIAEGQIKELRSKPTDTNQRGLLNVTEEQLELLKQGKEITLPTLKSYEQARNKALDLIGGSVPDSKPLIGRLGPSAGKGKIIGFQSADGKVRVRLDYDPTKGTHFNVEDFRTGGKVKIAVPFTGDEKTFKSYLKLINKWGALF